jgi:hypothetical protein
MDQLVQLIKSLSKEEKRKFKLDSALQKGQSDYIKVYEEILKLIKQDNYEEEVLVLRLRRKGIAEKSVPALKSYLFEQILKSLRTLQEEDNAMQRVKVLLSEAIVLEKRGIYDKCLAKITAAKNMALQYEDHLLVLQALKREQVWCSVNAVNQIEEELEAISTQINRQTRLLEIENDYRGLLFRVTTLYRRANRARDTSTRELLQEYFDHPALQDETLAKTFFSKVSFYHSHALLRLLEGNFPESNKAHRRLLEVWLGHPHFVKEHPMMYIIYVSNYLISCSKVKEYAPFEEYIPRLEAVELKYFNEKAEAFQNIYFIKQLYFINHGMFKNFLDKEKAASELGDAIEKGLEKYHSRIVKSREIALYHNTTIMYFALGKNDEAFNWANKIKNLKKTDQKKDVQLFARLILLLIHAENGNTEYLESNFKSIQYHLKTSERVEDFEGMVTKHLRDYSRNANSRKAIFQQFKEDLGRFSRNEIPYYDEIEIWVDSKLNNRSFFDELKHRIQSK